MKSLVDAIFGCFLSLGLGARVANGDERENDTLGNNRVATRATCSPGLLPDIRDRIKGRIER